MPRDIDISIVRQGRCSVAHVEGDINWHNSGQVLAAILGLFDRPHPGRVILDLQGAQHIDSSGISALLEALQEAKMHNTRFILAGLN
ncbi:MAG: STAS domain-containing protein, partial [Terriglobia bacterium]